MYEQNFQFSSRPFNSVPRLEDFFAGLSYQQAMDVTHMCVDRSTGPVVVVGSVGMGKSLLLQKIGQSFEARFDVVHIECSRLEERSELLQSILFELNLPYTGLTEGELRLSLMGYLKEGKGADDGVLLLVDEADRLSVALIDELRLITNQIRDGRSLVQLVLAGTQRLEESLTDPKLASFNQRIAARCVLQNLSKKETEQFIYQHIEQAGRAGDEIFADEAVDEIHRSTDGCPRLINQLCDQSLLLAASRDQQPVDQSLIREAWAEMQNMPFSPENAGPVEAQCDAESACVVEFGQLGEHETAGEFEDSQPEPLGEDPFAAQPPDDAGDSEQSEYVEAVSVEDSDDEQDQDGDEFATDDEQTDEFAAADEQGDEFAAADEQETDESNQDDSAPLGSHATAAALAATAFAATAFNTDPFAPQEEEQRLEDGNTESERIASLEQEQEELLEQTRGQVDSDEVQSAFDDPSSNEQESDPSNFEEIPAEDPFHASVEAEDPTYDDAEPEVAVQADAAEQYDATEGAFEASEENSQQEDDLSPMAQCSIEEQLGLVEPPATEPSSFHTPAFEPRPFVESEAFQTQDGEPLQDEDADSFAPATESPDPFSESFEEEEMLQDAYSPFVAEQNLASLDVTSSQLSHLTPLDEVREDEVETDSDDWNSQTPELAIEELDATGVSSDTGLPDVEGYDDPSVDGLQASDDSNTTDAVPTEDWQDNPETAWDPSQFQVPSEVESETPASFSPIPSVRTEIPSVVPSSEDNNLGGASAFDEDPFAPRADQETEQPAAEFSQSDQEPAIDPDLEALTSDLGAATTFDLADPQSVAEGESVGFEAPTESHKSSLMDLNDLVPGHLLQQMEEGNGGQDIFSGEATGQFGPPEHSRDSFAVQDQSAGFAVPYSAHASVDDFQAPEANPQAEAQRKTEEFMREFQAQRAIEPSDGTDQAASVDQVAASAESAEHPEEQSQEILKEIFSQQQILDEVHYTDSFASPDQPVDGQGADSVSVESPVTEYPNYQQPGDPPAAEDDRDMLYVNETQQYTPPQVEQPPEAPVFPNVETSTGNAERIDYNQLFERLRNSSPET